jgi:FeS assembly SUF system protein
MDKRPTELGTQRLAGQREEEPSTPAAPKTLAAPLTDAEIEELRAAVVAELHLCFDPEIPVNIYELGLIYGIDVKTDGAVAVRMTLTSPACPVAGSLPGDVKARLGRLRDVTAVQVDVVWEPPWEKERMSEAAKLQLGIDD